MSEAGSDTSKKEMPDRADLISMAASVAREARRHRDNGEKHHADILQRASAVLLNVADSAFETGVLQPGEDIAEALERQGDALSIRAARHIRIKWQTEEGLRQQLQRALDQLNASPEKAGTEPRCLACRDGVPLKDGWHHQVLSNGQETAYRCNLNG